MFLVGGNKNCWSNVEATVKYFQRYFVIWVENISDDQKQKQKKEKVNNGFLVGE